MSGEPDVAKYEEDREAERRASSMKDRLSKEVASWDKERRQRSSETTVGRLQSVIQRRSPRPAGESKKFNAPSRTGKLGGARPKPFSMSYDGVTQAEYTHISTRSWLTMSWVTFEVAGGGSVAVQPQHVVANYDELGVMKLSTTASSVHVLKETTVQRAAMKLRSI